MCLSVFIWHTPRFRRSLLSTQTTWITTCWKNQMRPVQGVAHFSPCGSSHHHHHSVLVFYSSQLKSELHMLIHCVIIIHALKGTSSCQRYHLQCVTVVQICLFFPFFSPFYPILERFFLTSRFQHNLFISTYIAKGHLDTWEKNVFL